MSSNYPPGHPTGYQITELDVECANCGEVTCVVFECDLATNGGSYVAGDPHCDVCEHKFSDAELDAAEVVD